MNLLSRFRPYHLSPQHHYQTLRNRLGLRRQLISATVLGKPILAHYGTFGFKPDKDDGWTFALSAISNVLYDVGCNTGTFTLLACHDRPSRRVVAIDANPYALAVAAEQLFANGFAQQVNFVLGFTSDTDEDVLDFYTVGTGKAGSRFRSHAHTASAKGTSLKVNTIKLDSLVQYIGHVPDLIKIDVEGAEVETLNGAKSITRQFRPNYIVELHSSAELTMYENGAKVLSWCSEMDYDTYYLPQHEKVTAPDPFAHRGRCHLYLCPRGTEYPAFLRDIPQGATIEHALTVLQRHNLR